MKKINIGNFFYFEKLKVTRFCKIYEWRDLGSNEKNSTVSSIA